MSEKSCFTDNFSLGEQLWAILQGITPGGEFAGLTDAQLRASAVPVLLPSGAVTDSATANVATNGTVTAGAVNVTFWASSDFTGTVMGVAFLAGASLTRTAPNGKTLPAYNWTRTAGTLYIAVMT